MHPPRTETTPAADRRSRATAALAVAVPAEALTTLALPAVLGGTLDAVLGGRPAWPALGLLAGVLLAGAAASALAAAAGPAATADAVVDLRGRLLHHVLSLRPYGPQQPGGDQSDRREQTGGAEQDGPVQPTGPRSADGTAGGRGPGGRPAGGGAVGGGRAVGGERAAGGAEAGLGRLDGGDLTARLVGSVGAAGGLRPARLGAVTALLTSAGAVVGLGVLSPWLALAFFGGVLPGIVVVRLFMRTAEGAFARYQEVQARLAAGLTGALAGVRTIHAAGAVAREADRVLRPLPELAATGRTLWSAQRRTVWQATLLVALVELAVLGTAGLLVADGALRAGAFAAAAGWAALGVGFFEQVEALVGVAHARAGLARVEEVLSVRPPAPGMLRLPDGTGDLAIRGAVVREAGEVLLGPIDLAVPGGSTVALVGRSGSGKSLLTELVGGLRVPDGGEVLIDGAEVTLLTAAERRRAVGYAFERPRLVGATVGDALEGAGEAETAAARADGFLSRLPAGLRTPVGELRLSGGELQRLGLARLLAGQPRVVVLDDATSSLDMVTEYQVQRALEESTRGRTAVVVAHRAQAAARADLVVWLDGGRIRARGRHADLLADPDYRAVLSGTALTAVGR